MGTIQEISEIYCSLLFSLLLLILVVTVVFANLCCCAFPFFLPLFSRGKTLWAGDVDVIEYFYLYL